MTLSSAQAKYRAFRPIDLVFKALDYFGKFKEYEKGSERAYKISRLVEAVVRLAWLVLPVLVFSHAWRSGFLKGNSEAITLSLTISLISITAYYTFWTRRLVQNEEARFEIQSRPIPVLSNFRLIETTPPSQPSFKPKRYDLRFDLRVYNNPMFYINFDCSHPSGYTDKKGDFDYVASSSGETIPAIQPDHMQVIAHDLSFFASTSELQKFQAYIKLVLHYSDKLRNSHKIIVFLSIRPTSLCAGNTEDKSDIYLRLSIAYIRECFHDYGSFKSLYRRGGDRQWLL